MMSWIQTHSKVAFSLTDPKEADVNIIDIAHALARLCRFNGHTDKFYSVAEHSVRASLLVAPQFSLDALLHDAAEAYVGDVTRPLKQVLGCAFEGIEFAVAHTIAMKFGVQWPPPKQVKIIDDLLLVTEIRDLLRGDIFGWAKTFPEPLASTIEPWTIAEAEFLFLNRFEEITGWKNSTPVPHCTSDAGQELKKFFNRQALKNCTD